MNVPWLVLHGAIVWKLALVAFLAAGGVGAALVATATAKRRAARIRREVGDPADLDGAVEGSVMTLTGTLETIAVGGGCADLVTTIDTGDACGTHRAKDVSLRVGSRHVALKGDVRVVVGSRERDVREAAARAFGVQVARRRGARMRVVGSGDRVRVTGTLRAIAPTHAASYRTAGASWTLASTSSPVLVASEAAPRVGGRWRSALAGAAYGLLAFAAVFGAGGEVAFHDASSAQAHRAASADVAVRSIPMWPFQLATISPFRRDGALRALTGWLAARPPYRPERAELLLALDALRGDCSDAADLLAQAGQLQRALDVARDCPGLAATVVQAHVWRALGDFDGAHEALGVRGYGATWSELEPRIEVALLAGRRTDAAMLADRAADALRADDSESRDRRTPDERRQILRCVADAVAGDAAARARLFEATGNDRTGACALLDADRIAGPQRIEALALARWLVLPSSRLQYIAGLLAAEIDVAIVPPVLLDTEWRGVDAPIDTSLVALERSVLERQGGVASDGIEMLVQLAIRAAIFEKQTGHESEARGWLSFAIAKLAYAGSGSPFPPVVARDLSEELAAATAALGDRFDSNRRAALIRAIADVARMIEERPRSIDAFRALARSSDAWRPLVEAAMTADGGAVAEFLWSGHDTSDRLPPLLAIASLVRVGRGHVAAWNRWAGLFPRGLHGEDLLGRLAARLAVANAYGDRDLASELEPAVRRLHDACLRRYVSVPIAVLRSL